MKLKELLLDFFKWSSLTLIKYATVLIGVSCLLKPNLEKLYFIELSITETVNIQLVLIGTTLAFASSLIGYSNVLEKTDKSRIVKKAEVLLLFSIYQILFIFFSWVNLKTYPLTNHASLHIQVFLISTTFIIVTLTTELFMVTGFLIRRLVTRKL